MKIKCILSATYLKATLLDTLHERRIGHLVLVLAGDEVDVLLILLHARNVVLEGRHLVTRGGSVVAQQVGNLLPVGRVLVDAELEVLAELLVELFEVLLVLGDLLEQLEALLDEVLADDLEGGNELKHVNFCYEVVVLKYGTMRE